MSFDLARYRAEWTGGSLHREILAGMGIADPYR